MTSPASFTYTSYFHSQPLGQSALRNPGLQLTVAPGYSSSEVRFTVTAQAGVAAWVWLEAAESSATIGAVQGYFEDNGFWLMRGESREVSFRVWEGQPDAAWAKQVTVRSMWDNLGD